MITITIETEKLTAEEEKEFSHSARDFGIVEEAYYESSENPDLPRYFIKNTTVKIT